MSRFKIKTKPVRNINAADPLLSGRGNPSRNLRVFLISFD
jgi:hypothetical protein